MRIQVVLTPTEGKKLIAKGIRRMEKVKKALEEGLLAIHPSSTTFFLFEELTRTKPPGVWVCGWVLPKGTCISGEVLDLQKAGGGMGDVLDFPHTWLFRKGKFEAGVKLGQILNEMDANDVYIKAGNALDPQGNVGVMLARWDGGTISRVIGASRGKGFEIVLGIGLEKLIPVPVKEAAKEAGARRMDHAIGVPVGLMPVDGTVVTEVQAIRLLTGAEAVPIGSGGLAGAEGSSTLVIKGEKEQVEKSLELVQSLKGARLPDPKIYECSACPHGTCHLNKKGGAGVL